LKVVVRFGGSVVASPVDPVIIKQFVGVLAELKEQRHSVVAVVGGGALARDFIEVGRQLGLDETAQDEVAILVSRLLAELFVRKLGGFGCEFVPTSIEEAVDCLQKNKVVVMGGLKPGMTTDAVAAMIAERVGADLLVKATDQEGIYTRDPKKDKDAEKIDRLSFDDLFMLFGEGEHKVGGHQILDSEAVRILRRSGVRVVVVSGSNPENILLATRGVRIGTLVE
jgi:uridylate kinase